jgi:hypothetical protein
MRRLVWLPRVAIALALAAICAPVGPAFGQWLKYPTPNLPRTADGKPNLTAPPPRMGDGKPDFSGIWGTNDSVPCEQRLNARYKDCGLELPISRFALDIAADMPSGLPYRPEKADVVKKRAAESSKDDPHASCLPDTFVRSYGLPHLQKYVQVPGLLVMLDEDKVNYRQVFTDGRPLPMDPNPAWNGYSSAKWEGDTLVIDSIGFRDDLWLDLRGNYMGSAAKLRERITRPDYGHLTIDATIDDPETFTRPWMLHLTQRLVVDTELVDEVCLENEKFSQRLKGH